jgi:hypothetical protein
MSVFILFLSRISIPRSLSLSMRAEGGGESEGGGGAEQIVFSHTKN